MEAFSPKTKQAGRTIGRWAKHYFYGMFSKGFTSGITAVDGAIGLAVGAAISDNVEKPTAAALLSIFVTSFGRSCLMWFKDNPIPEKLPESTISTPPFQPPPQP